MTHQRPWYFACTTTGVRGKAPYPIVVMLTSFDIGGTEHQMVELIRRLDTRLFDVHVACFHKRGSLLAKMPVAIPIETFPIGGFRRASTFAELRRFARWCRHVNARLVHTCDLYANIFGLTGAALARVPARIGSRREVVTGDKSRAQLRLQALTYRAAHIVVANSHAARERLLLEGVPAQKLTLIPNGVELRPVPATRNRAALKRIVVVANLRAEKGHDVLLDAMPSILARYPDAELHVAGDGPMRERLVVHAAVRGVTGRVRFLGERTDVPALLDESDLFVLPSRSEAFPNALIEAMAAGLPVVASRVGGIPELVTSGVNGVLVPPGDAPALAAAVVNLMDRPVFALGLGAAARAAIEQTYSFDRMIGSFERLYCATIERSETSIAPVTKLGGVASGAPRGSER